MLDFFLGGEVGFCLQGSLNPPPFGLGRVWIPPAPLKRGTPIGRLFSRRFAPRRFARPPFKGGRGDSKTHLAQLQFTPYSTYPESTHTVP